MSLATVDAHGCDNMTGGSQVFLFCLHLYLSLFNNSLRIWDSKQTQFFIIMRDKMKDLLPTKKARKVFIALFALAFSVITNVVFTSCSDDDNTPETIDVEIGVPITYSGTMSVAFSDGEATVSGEQDLIITPKSSNTCQFAMYGFNLFGNLDNLVDLVTEDVTMTKKGNQIIYSGSNQINYDVNGNTVSVDIKVSAVEEQDGSIKQVTETNVANRRNITCTFIGKKQGTPVYHEPNDFMVQMNQKAYSGYTSDANNEYFQWYADGNVYIYKRDIKTGVLTTLDQRPGPKTSSEDVNYTFLHLRGDYLYFEVFDPNSPGYRYTLCKVATDGKSPMEKVADLSATWGYLTYSNGKAYTWDCLHDDLKMYEVNLDDGTLTLVLQNETLYDPWFIVGNDVYARDYTRDGGVFHTRIVRLGMGTQTAQTVFDDNVSEYVTTFAFGNRLYVSDSNNLYSMNFDGSDKKTEFENFAIAGTALTEDAIIFLSNTGEDYKMEGVYKWVPGQPRPIKICNDSNLLFRVMTNGYGQVIIPTKDASSRFGQLTYLKYGKATPLLTSTTNK